MVQGRVRQYFNKNETPFSLAQMSVIFPTTAGAGVLDQSIRLLANTHSSLQLVTYVPAKMKQCLCPAF